MTMKINFSTLLAKCSILVLLIICLVSGTEEDLLDIEKPVLTYSMV